MLAIQEVSTHYYVLSVFVSKQEVVNKCSSSFFFQAEDGIRDLVRSRGLGDVYKRQDVHSGRAVPPIWRGRGDRNGALIEGRRLRVLPVPVSYTHLTLPTSDLV